jgi:hypothetical protein
MYMPDHQAREQKWILNGAQTPKRVQPALSLWIKLNFDFNKSIERALYVKPIDAGKREIRLKLASMDKFFYEQLPDGSVRGINRGPTVRAADAYIQNIYTNEEFYNIYLQSAKFSLIRTHFNISRNISDPSGNMRLDALSSAVESVRFGIRPVSNRDDPQLWYKFSRCDRAVAQFPIPQVDPLGIDPPSLVRADAVYYVERPIVNLIKFYIKNEYFSYVETNLGFFQRYMPTRGIDFSPDEDSMGQMTFHCKTNNNEQNAGYMDLSLNESLNVGWTSDPANNFISTATPAELVVSAICLRVLALPADSAVSFMSNKVMADLIKVF